MVCIHCICRNDDDGWDLTQHLKDEEEAEEEKKKNKENEHEDEHEHEICGQPSRRKHKYGMLSSLADFEHGAFSS